MFRPLALALLACLLHSCPLLAQARPASQANPALEEFKTLAGEWEGKDSHGGNVHVSYEVMSSGVVMERLQPEGGPGMMTMYSLDEDHIVAFHFCSEGNQPVLKTDTLSAATGKYNFTIERQLSATWSVQSSYVGNLAHKMLNYAEANPAIYGPGATTPGPFSFARDGLRCIGAAWTSLLRWTR